MVSPVGPLTDAAQAALSPEALRRQNVRAVPGVRRDGAEAEVPQKTKSIKDRVLGFLGLDDGKAGKVRGTAESGQYGEERGASGGRVSRLENSGFQAQKIAQSSEIPNDDQRINSEQRRGIKVLEEASLARFEFLPAYQPVDVRV